MFTPYAKGWAEYRINSSSVTKSPHTLKKVFKAPLIKQLEDELTNVTNNAIHIDIVDRSELSKYADTYTYCEGTPNFHHFVITKGAAYSPVSGYGWLESGILGVYNPYENRYKNFDIDSDILDFYLTQENSKFSVHKPEPDLSNLPNSFDLYALQWPKTIDLEQTIDALQYATNTKRHVVFSTHPTSNGGNDYTINKEWEWFDQHGYISEYTHVVSNTNTNTLVKHCNRLFSSCSAVNFMGLLYKKPTASYRNMAWSEVSPVIKNATVDFTDWMPTEEDRLRFLSWYYHELCVDITATGWQEKLANKFR